jgi:hypothetical protein
MPFFPSRHTTCRQHGASQSLIVPFLAENPPAVAEVERTHINYVHAFDDNLAGPNREFRAVIGEVGLWTPDVAVRGSTGSVRRFSGRTA